MLFVRLDKNLLKRGKKTEKNENIKNNILVRFYNILFFKPNRRGTLFLKIQSTGHFKTLF